MSDRGAVYVLPAVLVLALSFSFSAEAAPRKATFMPMWSTQAQFAGYYVALDKGIYRKYGIDLSIIPGGPDRSPASYLRDGRVDFTVMWLSTGIRERARGLRLVNIGQIVQRSALMLIAKKSSGIRTPEDMNGRRVSIWPGDLSIQPLMFFRKYHLKVKIIPQSFSVNLFLRGGTDVVSAMWYDEYHVILDSGLDPGELTVFAFRNMPGLNFPEDGIYMLRRTYMKDPALAHAFVKASAEGWAYAFAHPRQALAIVLKQMRREHVPANRMQQKWMLEKMKDLITSPGRGIGLLKRRAFERVARALKAQGVIKSVPRFSDFYIRCVRRAEK